MSYDRSRTTTFKAACQRDNCAWILSGPNYSEVIAAFLRHLKEKHRDYSPGSIGIMELGCDNPWEDADALFEE